MADARFVNGDIVDGLALAALSAVALNWGFFVQHEQAEQMPPLSLRRPLRSLRLLFSHKRWVLGFLIGIAGWAVYVAALRLAPLSLVQATSAGGIGILALLVWRVGGIRLGVPERSGVVFAIAGLALLGLSLGGTQLEPAQPASWLAVAAWMLASALLAVALPAAARRSAADGAALGAGAGLLYAAGDIATKAAVAGGAHLAFVPALLAAHGLAFVLLQLGFQRGGALATVGLATLLTNAVPIAAGTALFHESIPDGPLGALRIVAFAAVVVGAALLGRGERAAKPKPQPAAVALAAER